MAENREKELPVYTCSNGCETDIVFNPKYYDLSQNEIYRECDMCELDGIVKEGELVKHIKTGKTRFHNFDETTGG